MTRDIQTEINDLNSELIRAREAYYSGEPIMSDMEYDELEDKLKKLVTDNPSLGETNTVLKTVGTSKLTLTKIVHSQPVQSLDKVNNDVELYSKLEDFPDGVSIAIEPKIDGCTGVLIYKDWELVRATTRGDGEYGEIITEAVMAIKDIPKKLDSKHFPSKLEVRGELWISTKTLERLNSEGNSYANTRNLVAGSIKLKDKPEEISNRDIKFAPWMVLGLEDRTSSPANALEYLYYKGGFSQYKGSVVYNKERVVKKVLEEGPGLREGWKKGQGLETDGLVIKVNNYEAIEKLGIGTRAPRWAVAYKFPSELAETELLEIQWQVGRLGTITPVAIMEPVNVSGSMVSRATLNNITYMKKLGVKIGDKVSIKRANEVIPYIENVALTTAESQEIVPPTNCSECGCPLEIYEDPKSNIETLYCPSLQCGGRLKAHLTYMSQRTILDIEGLGPELASMLVENNIIEDIGDLYLWNRDFKSQLAKYGEDRLGPIIYKQGFPVAQTFQLNEGLEKSLTTGWDRWLAAIGIPGVGTVLAKKIVQFLGLETEDLKVLPDKLMQLHDEDRYMEGLGVKKLEVIKAWCEDPFASKLCTKLHEAGVQPKPLKIPKKTAGNNLPLDGEKITITGEFSSLGDREYLQQVVVSLGAEIKGISKKVTIVVAGEGAGPSKLAKATSLGLRIEDHNWLKRLMQENNIPFKPNFETTDDIEDL